MKLVAGVSGAGGRLVVLLLSACGGGKPEVDQEFEKYQQSQPASEQPQVTPMPSTTPSTASGYTDEQRTAARSVMMNVRSLATVEEEDGGGHLILNFSSTPSPSDPEQRLRFVKAVADADAVLQGTSRMIFFYRPDGSQFAQADPLKGPQLKGE